MSKQQKDSSKEEVIRREVKVFPIGTIVKVSKAPLLIIGYGFKQKEHRFELGYYVELYPIGFLSSGSVAYISRNDVQEVIFLPDSEDNSVLPVLSELEDSLQKLEAEDVYNLLNAIQTQLKNGGAG